MSETQTSTDSASAVVSAAPADVKLSKVDAKRLTEIKSENDKGNPFYSLAKPMQKLVTLKLVSASTDPQFDHPDNAGKTDDTKLFAFGVTADGAALLGKAAEVLAAPAVQRAPVNPGDFEILDNVTLPASAPVGRASIYPFDKIKVGGGFFVPNTDARPDAYKSMSSTISSKNKAGAKMAEGEQRRYELAKGPNDKGVMGAWVKRVA